MSLACVTSTEAAEQDGWPDWLDGLARGGRATRLRIGADDRATRQRIGVGGQVTGLGIGAVGPATDLEIGAGGQAADLRIGVGGPVAGLGISAVAPSTGLGIGADDQSTRQGIGIDDQATHLGLGAGGAAFLWVPVECLACLQAVYPEARCDPPLTMPASCRADWERDEATVDLLRRYGDVFWRLLEREAGWLPPWRDLLPVLHRMEARGDIRGGRFVAAVSGEQFAMPEAIPLLRDARRRPADANLICIAASDPLNLCGTVLPGDKIPALAGNRVLFRDGLPLATLIGNNIHYLVEPEAPEREMLRTALVGCHASPGLSRVSSAPHPER